MRSQINAVSCRFVGMRKQSLIQPLICLLLLGIFCDSSSARVLFQSDEIQAVEFFETRVRPLLAEHCFMCHGPGVQKPQGNLRLDSLASLLKGGHRGPALVPRRPEDSLLIEAVRGKSIEMPPGEKLGDQEINDLVQWIKWGAPWPETGHVSQLPESKKEVDWGKIRKGHWAWQPVLKPVVPEVSRRSWVQNPIDSFVLSKLEKAGLGPSPPADLRILVRRINLDLVGLLPSLQEVDEFVETAQKDLQGAVRQRVSTLLDSTSYGERWARHWLDVARYSDGFGGFLDRRDQELSQAWRYRDWVVSAFNRDLSYDQFVKLQISGDLIGDSEDALATGFFALGPNYYSDGGDPDSVAQSKGETLDDRIDTLTRGFLAITVSCARCHDHKFDPVPQQDYYSLAGIFNNTRNSELPLVPEGVVEVYDNHQQKIREIEQRQKDLRTQAHKEKRELLDQEEELMRQWEEQIKDLKESAPPKYDFAHTLVEADNQDMPVAQRGNLRKPGELAPRRFLKVIAGPNSPKFTQGSGRIELARAVASPDNPLTCRVMVNRIWMHHFGKAFVRSPSNFGALGLKPTHPKLLDWLSATFIESGWSIKSLHRLIMSSATYQMSSRFDSRAFAVDGDNKLIWRMNPRRMDVESWRDSLLAVTQELDQEMGGPPVEDITRSNRRTIYAKVSRNGDRFVSDEFLRLFDFPLMRATSSGRPTSIVPQQFLFLINSPFMVDRAKALSERLQGESDSDEERIERVYRLLFGRISNGQEMQLGLQFLLAESPVSSELTLWQRYCQVLMSSNEFMYVR